MKDRCGKEGGGKGPLIQEDKSATLSCVNDQIFFVPKVFAMGSMASNGMNSSNPKSGFYEADKMKALGLNGCNPNCNQGGNIIVDKEEGMYVVRRATPLECERFQGFPDNWTSIGQWIDHRGKKRETTPSNQFKALGNSMAVPVMKWIAERIDWALANPITEDRSKKEYKQLDLF